MDAARGAVLLPVDCLAAGDDADTCGLAREEALQERNPTLDYAADYPMMQLLDLSDAVCRPNICRAVEGNVLIYHDAHHLSGTYVRSMAGELGRQLADATGWWVTLRRSIAGLGDHVVPGVAGRVELAHHAEVHIGGAGDLSPAAGA